MLDQAIANDTYKIIDLVEIGQEIKISVPIPNELFVSNVVGIDTVHKKLLDLLPIVKNLAHAAFKGDNKNAWDTIQRLLYYWNYRDITRVERIKDDTPLIEYALRKAVLDIQLQYSENIQLECINDFTPERAVKELADKALSHRINRHPLLETLSKQGISRNLARIFLENYYVNNRLFHLFIAALSFCSPLARRTELANNFYDELGSGDNSMAHPVLFFKNFDSIGAPTVISPLPEALFLVNTKTYAAFLSGDYLYGMGGFGYIELCMPEQMKKILTGLEKTGLPKKDLEFWQIHITIDIEHGKTWFAEMLHLIKTPEQAQKCLIGGMRLLDARATMYDGIWNSNEK